MIDYQLAKWGNLGQLSRKRPVIKCRAVAGLPAPIMYHSDITNTGTIRDKDAKLTYDPEVNGGTLSIQGDDWAESICNNDVIAVVEHRDHDGADGATKTHKILYIPNVDDGTSTVASPEFRFEEIFAINSPQSFVDANAASSRLHDLTKPKKDAPTHNLYIIISTISGTGQAQQYFDNIIKPTFTSIGIQEYAYYVHTTYSDKSISNFTSSVLIPRANEGIPQTVLLLSGDGGIVDIVNTILPSPRTAHYKPPAIGLIALGTGNAFANSVGLNRDHTRGLRHFFRGSLHPIPTFTATFSPGSSLLIDEGQKSEPLPPSDDSGCGKVYGAVVCSWALHAALVADSDTASLRKYGSQRFQMAAKELLMPFDGFPPHAYKGKITLFTKDEQGNETQRTLGRYEHMYILATLVSNLEEKLTISPHSKPLDGQLRLLHFGPFASSEVMRILGLAFQGGKHVEDGNVGYQSVEGMRIEFEEEEGRWRRVCVDGKIVCVGEGGWVEVRMNDVGSGVLDIIADLVA